MKKIDRVTNRSRRCTALCLAALMCVMAAGPETAVAKKAAVRTTTKKITVRAGQKVKLKNRAVVRKFFGKKALKKNGRKITWTSSKKKVATVSAKGILRAKKKGKTTVRASYKKKVIRFKVTVKATKSSDSKKKSPSDKGGSGLPSPSATVKPGQSAAPTATATASPSSVPTPTPTLTPTPTPVTVKEYDKPLRELYQSSFMVGAAINGTDADTAAIRHEGMANILKTHFNSTTLSNLMKPVNLLDEEACRKAAARDGADVTEVDVTFDVCRESLEFCRENNISMRGHVLVWHNQTPEWFFKKGYDADNEYVSKEIMEQRLENYIRNVLEYCQTNYPGVVYCWDVVNECVNDGEAGSDNSDGWHCRTTFGGGDNYWYATMGTDYVYKAFEYARKYAAPEVKLIYNDYNVFQPWKRDNICTLLGILKSRGLVDGVGLQPTVLLNYPSQLKGNNEDSFETCLRAYGRLGMDIQITELSFEIPSNLPRSAANLRRQAERYQEMYELLLAMDDSNGGPCHITSVTSFGICDDYPLYEDNRQCLYLFNADCTPKEAFARIYLLGKRYAEEGKLTMSDE